MFTIVRHTLVIVIASLGSLAAGSSVGQVPMAADTAAPAKTPLDAGESHQAGYDAERGHALYITHCSACHGADGEGRAGTYPPLKGSGVVTKDDSTKHIQVVLKGLQGGKAGGVLYTTPMPPFGGILNDVDAANIIDYERSTWGNHGKLVVPAEVAAQRDRSK
jgi:cytochrome c oxidase cbb3-type subunit 2